MSNTTNGQANQQTSGQTSGQVGEMFRGPLRFLSNFDTTGFEVRGLGHVASGEHAFNALKTLQVDQQAHVLDAPSPGEAKRRGRRLTLRAGWDTGVRVRAMQAVVAAKFNRTDQPTLRVMLTATGDLHLVETNTWHDQFWGDCTCPRHAGTPGVNMLGELLMATRCETR